MNVSHHIATHTNTHTHTCMYVSIYAIVQGYHVFNIEPFQQRVSHFFPVDSADGGDGDVYDGQSGKYSSRYHGVGVIEMLFSSNILAMVGGGPNPAFGSRNKLVLWDNQQMQMIGEIVTTRPVRAVRMHRNIIVVVLENKVQVFDNDIKEVHSFETVSNPEGIVALSLDTDNIVLAFPSVQTGIVRCVMLDMDRRIYIKAHEGEIACIALNRDGTRLATASEKGTLIRIFDTASGDQLKEVRRGSSQAKIWSIAFSSDNRYLCCVASSGSVHLFDISTTAPNANLDQSSQQQSQQQQNAPNRTSSLSVLGMVGMEWVQSEWSFAEHKEEAFSKPGCKCAFGPSNKQVRVLTPCGYLFDLTFDLTAGGDCIKIVKKNFMPMLEANQ